MCEVTSVRWIKWLAAVLGGLALLVVGAGAAVYADPGPVLTWALKHPVSAMIGRAVHVDGPVAVHWGAPTRIVAENVHVANAPWGSEPEMFSAERLEVDVFVTSLLHGPPRLPLVALDGAKLLLETSKQGEGNWKFGASAAAPKKRGQFPDLRRFTADRSDFVYRNGVTGARSDLGIADLDYEAPDPAQPIKVTADGTFQKQPLKLTGSAGPLSALRNPAKPYPVKLEGGLGEVALTIDGTVARPLDFDGVDVRLSLRGRKLAELASALGVPLPELPEFRGTSKLEGGNGKWKLDAITIALGKSDLEGGIDIDTTQKVPDLRARLTSNTIDLADFKGLYGGRPAHAPAAPRQPSDSHGRIIPDTPIAVHKLPGVNADVTFDGTRIIASGGVPVERVSLGLQLKDGEITVKPLRFATAHGDVDLDFHFTPFTTAGPPKLDAELDVRHVDLHDLLRNASLRIVRETAGTVGGFAKVETSGVSLREFLAHMNGDAGIFMADGQLSNLLQELAPIDVLGALGVYIAGDKPVPIDCLVSRFDIKAGVATASTLLFDTADTQVAGAGNINFADETLFLTLTPRNKRFTAVSLRTPVDVGGTFAKPAFHLHAGELAARVGAAIGLGVVFPPAALLPLIDAGLGERNACSRAYAAQRPPGEPTPKTGSSSPPR